MIDRNNGEVSDSTSPEEAPDGYSLREVESGSIVDEARRTSEAAGLAHWTAPPTGHVPKAIGKGDGFVATESDDWGVDLSDAFSDPEPLAGETTDGFGTRTRDPLVDFSGGPGVESPVNDPLADFAAVPGSVTRDPLADFEPATKKNFTEEVPAVDGFLPPDTLETPMSGNRETSATILDLSVEKEEPEMIDLGDPVEVASRAELQPKHRSTVPHERSVFDLPPSEQVGTPSPPIDVGHPISTGVSEYDQTVVGASSGYDAASNDPEPFVEMEDLTTSAPLENLPRPARRHVEKPDLPIAEALPPLEAESPPLGETLSVAGAGRDLIQATAVGLVLAALAGLALWAGPAASTCLIAAFAVLAVMEFYTAMTVAGLRPAALLGMVGVASIQASIYFQGADAYPLVMSLIVVFGVLWYLVGADNERPVLNLGLTMMGLLWVGGLAGFGVLMVREPLGIGLVVATIVVTVVSDTLAYGGGRILGATPFHSASPNKTWEGTLSGFAGALVCGLALGWFDVFEVFDGSVIKALVLAAVVGLLAPIGDLAESMMKRDLGVKDMGTLLPGHGGVMDRLDGLLFALPGAYYVALVFNLL